MSNLYYRHKSLAGLDVSAYSIDELKALVKDLLEAKIHGICFSPYIEGQGPGTRLAEDQIRERLAIVQPYVNWIRTFSCTDGNELIPKVAAEYGIKTLVGVWLDDNHKTNEEELSNALEVANAGHANLLGVGNEVLLRGELTQDELISYIERTKDAVPDVAVGYVDAYFLFENYQRVTDACDVIFANCYPFWEGYPAEHALVYMKEMYRRAVRVANGKKVIISETGWPNRGSVTRGGAVPSFENAVRYFINAYQWAEEEEVEIFYFSSFDETWKVAAEGDVGAYWGLWDKDGALKYA